MIEMSRSYPLHIVIANAERRAVRTGFKQRVHLDGPYGPWQIESTETPIANRLKVAAGHRIANYN